MPTYTYAHEAESVACDYGHEFDFSHSISISLVCCPKCEKPVKRLIAGGTSIKLLGGGWAKDNYSFTSHPRFNPNGGKK